jgi:predicted NBD/HSP70 family sugar kinase
MPTTARRNPPNSNAQLILKTIYDNGSISRADIARSIHLTKPTVSNIVRQLQDDDLVVEIGLGPSAGGKPPTMLAINADARQLVCIDLSSRKFRGALANLRGEFSNRLELPVERRTGTEALQLVYALVDRLIAASTQPLLGIGIGSPGLINPLQGVVRQAVNLGWYNLPLKKQLESRYALPVHISNDSHSAGLAEYMFGEVRDSNNLITIKIGQGIGAGIVLDGQPLYGDGFGAGEIGHVVVAEGGALCTCGNRGCLETIAGTRSLLAAAQVRTGNTALEWPDMVDALRADDRAVSLVVTHAGERLGVAVANLIAAFNIHHIVVSGRVEQFGRIFLESIRDEARRRTLPGMVYETNIDYSTLGQDIVLLGSSALVLKHELGLT